MKIISKLFSSSSSKKEQARKTGKETHDSSSITLASDLSSSRDGSSRRSNKSNRSNKKSSKMPPSAIPQTVLEYQTPNEMVITALLNMWNKHASAEEIMSVFASPEVPVRFEDTPDMPVKVLVGEVQKLFQSFPDMSFKYESIKEDRTGLVLVEECIVSGTHTGAPYGFAHFPPVPTTHKHVLNDPERFWFKVKDGKVTEMQVIALGGVTGPPGFYMSVGGKMEMPPPSAEEGSTKPEGN